MTVVTDVDITQAQGDHAYLSWLASRLPADQWDHVHDLLWHLRALWEALHPEPGDDPDTDTAVSELLDAEAELGALLGLLVDR